MNKGNTAITATERDFKFTDQDFENIRVLVRKHTGIALSNAKKGMVYSRLSRRLRSLKLESFCDYCKIVESDGNGELTNFTNSITTNLTSFFREKHHFDFLTKKLMPELIRRNSDTRRIRIWSCASSTGEEPYSIAIAVREAIPRLNDWDIKILATDLDTNVLATAKKGIYNEERVEDLPKQFLKKWFRKGKGTNEGMVGVVPELQEMISFQQLNLLKQWPIKNKFDILFCRNVVIYFDKPTQVVLFKRFADVMHDYSHLLIGHSESLFKVNDQFKLLGQTIYQKNQS